MPAAARRSAYAATYLTPEQRAKAQLLFAIEFSKARSRDIAPDAVEELFAELIGGSLNRHRDATQHGPDVLGPVPSGVAWQVKSRRLKAAVRTPEALDRLGERVQIEVARIRPARLPRGKTLADASASAIGAELIKAYNRVVVPCWDALALFVRLHCPQLQAEQIIHWTEPAQELEGRWLWRDSERSPHSVWERNLQGWFVPTGSRLPDRPCDLSWSSGGYQLRCRVELPADADIIHVPLSMLLDRRTASEAIAQRIMQGVLAA